MPMKFVLYEIAPVDINKTLQNAKANLLITRIKANVDLKIVPEKSRSQGSQNGICAWRQDDESVTEHQGSQNEPLWELKWPLSACSGAAQECSPSA